MADGFSLRDAALRIIEKHAEDSSASTAETLAPELAATVPARDRAAALEQAAVPFLAALLLERANGAQGTSRSAEMRAHLRAATEQPEWVPAVAAQKLRVTLEETDPALLHGWLQERADAILSEELRDIERRRAATARRQANQRAFKDAADSGDIARLGLFAVTHAVSADNLRKAARDMTRPDHLFVATEHADNARENRMLAEFHKAVARKIGDDSRTTSQVMSEETYEALYLSIVRKKAA